MKLLLNILFAGSVLSVSAQDAFVEGNTAYTEEHYKTALQSYLTLVDSVTLSSEVYYNIGNAYYKTDQPGKAIWAYEKALKIDPKNEDAKFNLEYVSLFTEGNISQPEPALTEWLKRLLYSPKINLWAYISISCSIGLSLMILLFISTSSRRRRNLSLMGGMTFALFLVFSTSTAYFHKQSILDRSEGIIVSKKAEILLSPLEKAGVSFELDEGSKVHLLDENETWLRIEVNGNSGWVRKEDVWII
jgi:tetratricopeptide (TPR) repeat protein